MTRPQLSIEMAGLLSQVAELNRRLVEAVEERDAVISKLQAELEAERNKIKDSDLLSPVRAAKLLDMSVSFLSKDRKKGEGKNIIPYVQNGPRSAVKYRRHDLQAFLDSKKKPGLRLAA